MAETKNEKSNTYTQLSTVPIVLPTTYSITHSTAKPTTAVGATTIFTTTQLQNTKGMLIPGVSSTGKTFSLVTTTPTTTGNLIFLSQTPTSTTNIDNLVKVSPTKIITSVAPPGKVVQVREKMFFYSFFIDIYYFKGSINCFTSVFSHNSFKIGS